MNIQKPHFWYDKSQRNGVFLLLFTILFVQLAYLSVAKSSCDDCALSLSEIALLEGQIDSLKQIRGKNRLSKAITFNPNYLTDYRASVLGLSMSEIDLLFLHRTAGLFINSMVQFQEVTGVSDSLLAVLTPQFKFPTWVQSNTHSTVRYSSVKKMEKNEKLKDFIAVKNINTATQQDLERVNGVNFLLAKRIISYRERLQGFTYEEQLLEVWKLHPNMAIKIWNFFRISEKPKIKKVNINVASFKDVLAIPYIDYQLCQKMFDFRDEVAELQSIEELKNIEGFPLDKYDRIVLYLEAK